VTPTESGRVNRPAAPFPRSGESRRCAEPAPRQQENPEIGSGVSGQNPRDVVVAAAGSRGFQVFMSESAAGKREIYVSQVKTIGYYQNKKS